VTALATLAEFLADEGRRVALLSASDPASIRQLIEDFEGGAA
jgi:mannitol/fructose-specific phosphotransferase system IIA component (Ntr-type)